MNETINHVTKDSRKKSQLKCAFIKMFNLNTLWHSFNSDKFILCDKKDCIPMTMYVIRQFFHTLPKFVADTNETFSIHQFELILNTCLFITYKFLFEYPTIYTTKWLLLYTGVRGCTTYLETERFILERVNYRIIPPWICP